jgi:hypothetical protein
MEPAFLLLIAGLPPSPSSLRVRLWRRLRAVGAVALKRSVYLLPDSTEHYEQFQWLAQEIQRDGGEATLVRIERIENMSRADIVRRFQEARDQEYRELAARYRKLVRALEAKRPSRRMRVDEELARLERDLERVREIDFFDAPGRAEVLRLKEVVEARARPGVGTPAQPPSIDLARLRGRRWVTRLRPHVDRIASAWLIKRFIDPDATFVFADPRDFPADAVPFDTPGAELSHRGDDCTFETLVKRAGLHDRRLTRLAEIVHEADLRDGKFPREEARGIDLAIRGLLAALKDDHEVLASGLTLFDGLYASVTARE